MSKGNAVTAVSPSHGLAVTAWKDHSILEFEDSFTPYQNWTRLQGLAIRPFTLPCKLENRAYTGMSWRRALRPRVKSDRYSRNFRHGMASDRII